MHPMDGRQASLEQGGAGVEGKVRWENQRPGFVAQFCYELTMTRSAQLLMSFESKK